VVIIIIPNNNRLDDSSSISVVLRDIQRDDNDIEGGERLQQRLLGG
jgi:hypothetical protein